MMNKILLKGIKKERDKKSRSRKGKIYRKLR